MVHVTAAILRRPIARGFAARLMARCGKGSLMTISFAADDDSEQALKRACYRIALGFFTSFIERIIRLSGGQMLDGVILAEIIYLNVFGAREDTMDRKLLTQEPLADELRRPVSVYLLARRLSQPYETVRRHVARLVDRGFCTRSGRNGVVVSFGVISGLVERQFISGLLEDLDRLVGQLDAVGAVVETGEPDRLGSTRDWIG